MMRKIFLLLLCLPLVIQPSTAQVFGGNPPGLRFFQLKTDSVRVIFPEGLEREAREVAWTVHHLYRNNPAPLGNRLRRFDVVLQNQTIQSNGYVGIAPYRSEYYMMPPLHNITDGSIPWHLALAVHEHRHMEQFANFNRTIPRVLGKVLGQEGTALGFGAVVPNWFFEGDAIWQETLVTGQGRGRLPNFFNAYRSLWQASRSDRYMKLRNGSFRQFVPNHYDLGYLLVAYGREQYGLDFWKRITQSAVDYRGFLYPLQRAIKRETGMHFKQFADSAFTFFRQQMQLQPAAGGGQAVPITKPERNNVVNYQYPYVMNDGSILTLKSSYRQIPVWIKIDSTGMEQQLRVKDIGTDAYYSYNNNRVVYTAFEPDARWGWREYAVVKVWDVSTGAVTKLSSKSRLFMPDIDQQGSKVVAVQVTTNLQHNLVLMPVTAEAEIQLLPNPDEWLYTYPKFADAQTVIAAVRNKQGEMSVAEINMQTGDRKLLVPFANNVFSYLQVYGDSVLLTAGGGDADRLLLLRRSTSEVSLISKLPNGSYQAVADADRSRFVFSTFSADGYRLLQQKSGKQPLPLTSIGSLSDLYLSPRNFTSGTDLVRQVQQQPGAISRYKQGPKLLNIHSWRPTVFEPDYGITFFSENVMNNFTGEYNYLYNRNEGFHRVGASMVYGGWYPLLRTGVQQTWNRQLIDDQNRVITWNETNFNAGVSVPLNFTSGRTFKSLTLASSFNTEQLQYTGAAKQIRRDESLNYLTSSLVFINQSQRAFQQLFPRWAQTFRVQYRNTINGGMGNQLFVNAGIYLPGLMRNHNLVLFGSVQARDTLRGGLFSNSFPFARGYNAINFPRAVRWSANYHLPLFYPDAGVGNIVYLLRVRANLFYDYTVVRSLRLARSFPLSSTGCELFFDMRLWNLFPVSIGVRYTRLLQNDLLVPARSANQFELVLPMDLF